MNHQTTRRLVAIALILAVGTFPKLLIGQPPTNDDGSVALLKRLGKANRANAEAIKTWQGTVRVVDISTGPNLHRTSESTVTFAFDRSLDAKQFRWQAKQIQKAIDGTIPEGGLIEYLESGLLKDETYVHAMRFSLKEPRNIHKSVTLHSYERDEKAKQLMRPIPLNVGALSTQFDPFYYLNDQKVPAADRLLSISKRIDFGNGSKWRVESDKNEVQVIADIRDPESRLINDYRVDQDKSANFVFLRFESQDLKTSETRTFNKINEIWVPIKVVHKRISLNPQEIHDRREVTWLEQRINEPVDPKVFTRDAIGVQPGDTVIDKRPKKSDAPEKPDE